MGWAAASSSLRRHIPGAADGVRVERNVYRGDYAYTHTDAECDPNSNAGADTDSLPHTDAHAVPIAKPNANATRDQPFHLRHSQIRRGRYPGRSHQH